MLLGRGWRRGERQVAVSVEHALALSGVRYIAVELGTGQDLDIAAVRTLGRAVVDTPMLLVVDVGGPPRPRATPFALLSGWTLTLIAISGVLGARGVARITGKLPAGLLRSRP